MYPRNPASQPRATVMSGSTPPSNRWLRRTNNLLLVLVVLTNLYVIAIPFLPQLMFTVGQQAGQQQKLEQKLSQPAGQAGSPPPSTGTPAGNHLIIPAMLLDQPVVEGANMYRALDQGVWRWPGGSTPDKGSNTVMLAHRFTYTKPKGVFYFLDKLKPGDNIGVSWDGAMYVYKVTTAKVVHPTQTEILNPTKKPTLTLYTCTPLWLPKDRLVITAELQPDPAAHPQLDTLINQQ